MYYYSWLDYQSEELRNVLKCVDLLYCQVVLKANTHLF